MANVLFDENYDELKAQDIRIAFEGDQRLVQMNADILQEDLNSLFISSGMLPSKCI